MTQTNDNIIDRDQLQEAYIESIIDGMDHKTMYQFVYDSLNGNLDDYTVPSVGVPISLLSPKTLPLKLSVDRGAELNVICDPLIV